MYVLRMHEHTSTPAGLARRAARHPVDLTCEIISHYADEPHPLRVADLSVTGAWIDAFLPMHVGAEVVLSLRLPRSKRELFLFGRVSRVRTGRRRSDRGRLGMGVAFVDVTTAQRRALARIAVVASHPEAA